MWRSFLPLLLALGCLVGPSLAASPPRATSAARLVEIRSVDPSILIELRYNTTRNIFGRRLYQWETALLREPVAQRLARVQARLRKQGLGLKIWDAYRPQSVQYVMWRIKPGTRYLANPRKGSRHNRGAAVDLTLVDANGRELPMPTPYDEFSPRAHRGATQGVSAAGRMNARVLDAAMRAEGFRANAREWWHFDSPDWRNYPLSNYRPTR